MTPCLLTQLFGRLYKSQAKLKIFRTNVKQNNKRDKNKDKKENEN